MEKQSLYNKVQLVFRLSILVFAFFFVLYAMRYTKTNEFAQGVNTLFGAPSKPEVPSVKVQFETKPATKPAQ